MYFPPFRYELWGINTHGSGAFNTSELLLHSSPLIIDELFFPSHTTLRSIENNLILVFPSSYSTTLFFFPMLHLYDTKQLVVKETLEAGVEEVLLNWVWSTLSLQNEGNVSLYERTIHKYITCSVLFFRLEQFFSLLWETQNHSCVFSAWCAD